jgi:hypothetical protein
MPLKIRKKVVDDISSTKDLLVHAARTDEQFHASVLFLLGQDENGTIVDFERLGEDRGGCPWVPAISTEEVIRAYLALAKRNTTPGIFCHFIPLSIMRDVEKILNLEVWYGSFGYDPIVHPGRIFVRILNGRCVAIRPDRNAGRAGSTIEVIPIEVVP